MLVAQDNTIMVLFPEHHNQSCYRAVIETNHSLATQGKEWKNTHMGKVILYRYIAKTLQKGLNQPIFS